MTDLPNGWRRTDLGSLGLYINGRGFKKSEWRDHGRPIIRIQNLTGSSLAFNHFDGDADERHIARAGDLLVSWAATLGAYIWKGPEGVVNQHIFKVDSNIDKKFHKYLLDFKLEELMRQTHGSGMVHITRGKFDSVPVSVPQCLDEQRRIVEILEDHLSRLAAAESDSSVAQTKTAQWQRSIMLRAILGGSADRELSMPTGLELAGPLAPDIPLPSGWRWSKWRDIGSSKNGTLFPSSDYSDEGIRLLRPGNMGADGSLTWYPKATRRLPVSYATSHVSMLLAADDLVMNLTAQSLKDDFLGRVCLVGPQDSSLLNQRIARLRTSELVPGFALLVFRSPLFREHVKALNTGSLIQHMFTKQINEFWLPVPPKDVQAAVAAFVADRLAVAVRMTDAVDTMRTRSAALHRSLLAAALSGRLTGRRVDMDLVEEMAGV